MTKYENSKLECVIPHCFRLSENSNGEIIVMGQEGSVDSRKGHQSEVRKE